MEINEVYANYGKAMVQLEILQNQIGELKKAIAADINKQNEVKK